ncbi:MAG: acidobacterial duplicated orphan ABC-type permease-like protein [Ferruginibacter sp.]|uniref:ABC transporter permease n=1 Tax=Ferruginibacter sp. TaxID=1940288 RepID=UPI00265B24A6|nr:ABC transporter permease [Ferruginibacter sp.]MDB5279826.1 acidobacterial duplicated orphan ABC-type permease-like protein [Ferruginibacter sp.]
MYFKLAIRNLKKNKLFTAVNIIGLSVGIASVMALSFSVYQYITTDRVFKGKADLYYLKTSLPSGDNYMQTTFPLLDEVVRSCPEVEAATHTQTWNTPWLKYGEKEAQERTMYVERDFFKVFTFPLTAGNAANALDDKFSAVISYKIARQLFGTENPMGKTITADDSLQLTVTGVLAPQANNNTVKADVLLSIALLKDNKDFIGGANWYNTFASNFLRLKKGTSIPAFEAKLAKIVAANYAPENKQSIIKAVSYSNIKEESGPLIGIIIKGSVGAAIFILLIIVVNLVNLNAATMYTRSKEVGVRQMMGSGKKNIILQFCVENGLLVLFSLVCGGLLFMYLLLPQMNKFTGDNLGESVLNIKQDYPFLLLFILIGAVITMVAGSLPASRLTAFKISDVVKGKLGNINSGHGMRNVFITVQFTLAIVFIGITVILNRQINYMRSVSIGFNKENVVVVKTDLAFKNPAAAGVHFESLLNQLKADANVKSFSTTSTIPTAYWDNYNTYIETASGKEVKLKHAGTDAGYLKTFEIPLVEGRDFDDALAATEGSSIIINKTAMKAFGWTSAIGKKLTSKGSNETATVVGVMEDFNYQNTQGAIEPLLHWYTGKQKLAGNNYLSINTTSGYQQQLLQRLQKDFAAMPGRRPFKYDYMSDLVNQQYTLLNGILSTTNFIAFLTILVASMGMFGLIALLAKQKIKEIGVRKVLGASIQNIVAMLSKDFLKLVLVASIIALPVAWYAMHNWLNDFAYRIEIKWWMLVLTSGIAVLIVLFTVGFQSVKAALMNPVKSLRSE